MNGNDKSHDDSKDLTFINELWRKSLLQACEGAIVNQIDK